MYQCRLCGIDLCGVFRFSGGPSRIRVDVFCSAAGLSEASQSDCWQLFPSAARSTFNLVRHFSDDIGGRCPLIRIALDGE